MNAILSAALLLVSTATGSGSEDFLLKIGDPAPPFSMRDLNGKPFSLANHVGPNPSDPRKAVFVVFFATWCEPCKKEVPIIKRIHKRWKDKGVQIVYIGLAQGPKDLGPFAKAQKLPWPVVPDTFGLLARRYGASQLPHALLVNHKAEIAFQHRGIAPDLQQTIELQLAKVTGESVPSDQSAPAAVDKPRFDTNLVMGRLPSSDGAASRWQPLAAYLGEGAKAQIAVTTEETYEEFERALQQGKYDLVNAGPLLCQQVKSQYEPLAKIERQGTPTYLGIIFAKRQLRAKRLEDLKGKTIALVSPKSTSGGLYPQKALLDAGLVPGKDIQVKWVGSHSEVGEAVKSGAADAGGCYEDCRDAAWPRPRAKALATHVVAYTPDIPAEMIIVKRSLDPAIKRALRQALLKVNEQEALLEQISQGEPRISAMAPANDKDLAPVAEVSAFVRQRTKAQ